MPLVADLACTEHSDRLFQASAISRRTDIEILLPIKQKRCITSLALKARANAKPPRSDILLLYRLILSIPDYVVKPSLLTQ